MDSPPPIDLETAALHAVLGRWARDATGLTYLPFGAGSFHWRADLAGGRATFVTVDDLTVKSWLGDDIETAFTGLERAYGAAAALAAGGRESVVAPRPSISGAYVERLSARYAVSVQPWVEGTPGAWGEALPVADRQAVARMLAMLHASDADPLFWSVRPALPSPPVNAACSMGRRRRTGPAWRISCAGWTISPSRQQPPPAGP